MFFAELAYHFSFDFVEHFQFELVSKQIWYKNVVCYEMSYEVLPIVHQSD